jgi:membrane protein implicated in regulation of membrane protease activity
MWGVPTAAPKRRGVPLTRPSHPHFVVPRLLVLTFFSLGLMVLMFFGAYSVLLGRVLLGLVVIALTVALTFVHRRFVRRFESEVFQHVEHDGG